KVASRPPPTRRNTCATWRRSERFSPSPAPRRPPECRPQAGVHHSSFLGVHVAFGTLFRTLSIDRRPRSVVVRRCRPLIICPSPGSESPTLQTNARRTFPP